MTGALPTVRYQFTVTGNRTEAQATVVRSPEPGEVVVAIAGSALGAQPGAEIAGTVLAAGDAATDWLGRQVVVPRLLPCGECPSCRRGRAVRCTACMARGLVATHETVPARYLLAVDPLPPAEPELWRWAALADAASAPYGGLVRAQVAPGDLLVILGLAPRGRFAIALGRALGAHVVALGPREGRELALAAGAHLFLDGEQFDAPDIYPILRAEAIALGIDPGSELKVLETTATSAGRRRAIDLVGQGGTVALLAGGTASHCEAALRRLAETESSLVGAGACHPDLFPELGALIARGDLAFEPELEALPFAALAEALADQRCGRRHRLPVLVP